MPLTIREKPNIIERAMRSVKKATGTFKQNMREWVLEVILLLLVVMNFWIELRIILVVYLVFYFVDRWGIKAYINHLAQPITTQMDKDTLKKIDKIKGEKANTPAIQSYDAK